jgi:hypothetical protein
MSVKSAGAAKPGQVFGWRVSAGECERRSFFKIRLISIGCGRRVGLEFAEGIRLPLVKRVRTPNALVLEDSNLIS